VNPSSHLKAEAGDSGFYALRIYQFCARFLMLLSKEERSKRGMQDGTAEPFIIAFLTRAPGIPTATVPNQS
jgi:hypothetical protein